MKHKCVAAPLKAINTFHGLAKIMYTCPEYEHEQNLIP